MSTKFRLAFSGSPFLPMFDQQIIVGNAVSSIRLGYEPAPSIAIATYHLMSFHVTLLNMDTDTLKQYDVEKSRLADLNLGYQYPIQTVMASAVCKNYPPEQRHDIFEELVTPTHDFDTLRAQDQMLRDLRATINLLEKDPSGSLVFEFLNKYPFSTDEFFLNGMEIAAMVFFGISLQVAKEMGDEGWLTFWQGGPQFS